LNGDSIVVAEGFAEGVGDRDNHATVKFGPQFGLFQKGIHSREGRGHGDRLSGLGDSDEQISQTSSKCSLYSVGRDASWG
jgi:hypothetical protein